MLLCIDHNESECVLLLNPRVVKRSKWLTDLHKCENKQNFIFIENMK